MKNKQSKQKEFTIPVHILLKKILKTNRGNWKSTYITWLFVMIETVCETLVTFFLSFLIDSINSLDKSKDLGVIFAYSGGIFALAVVAALTGILAGYFAAEASSSFGRNLRKAIFSKIQDYSFENIDKFSTSSIVTRSTTDLTNVQHSFLMVIRSVIRAPLLMIFALIMCFIIEYRLAWIFLLIIPFVLFLLITIASRAHVVFVKIFNSYDILNSNVQEDVDGIRAIKSFNREDSKISEFKQSSNFIYKNFIKAEKILAFNAPVMDIAIYLAFLLLSFFGANLIVKYNDTNFSIGSLTSLFNYVMMIMISMMMISTIYVMLIISRNSGERIIELLDEKPILVNCDNPVYEIKNGDIEFKNVSFAYPNKNNSLENISFSLKSGEVLGIIGPTGSSKTTLVSMIARLYDVKEGCVKVGGVDVKNYDLKTLRDSVSVVLQKNTLFSGTIRSNLSFGNEYASDEQIWEALSLAQASDFVSSFKDGLDYKVEQGGVNFSGGQKQRLCIARALLKDPKILILDDTTSACDTHTDQLIRDNLKRTKPDVTKIIISQRVSSIKDCDKIIVMDRGKIIAEGKNDELMDSCGIYKELYESQLGGGDFDAQ